MHKLDAADHEALNLRTKKEIKMDMNKFVQILELVKLGFPKITSIELKDYMKSQDRERQHWFETASNMDIADWIVATKRRKSEEVG